MSRQLFSLLFFLFASLAYADDDCAWREPTVTDAESGDAQAQARLGKAYFFGMCVEADTEEAMYWYFRAAEAGSDGAVYAIGLAFSTGLGLTENRKLAKHYFQRAARNGHEAAIVNLANITVTEQFGKCDGTKDIDLMIEQVESPEIRVLFDQTRFEQLKEFCRESGEKIRSPAESAAVSVRSPDLPPRP